MITKEIRKLVIRLNKNGDSYRNIAKTVGIAPNSVRNIILGRNKKVKDKRGPKNKLTKDQTLAIKRSIGKTNEDGKQVTAKQVMKSCNIDNVSVWTVRRKLGALGYKYKKAEKAIVLTNEQKKKRVELARYWIDQMWPWNRVIWTDEKRFSLDGPDSWASWMREGQHIQRNRRQQGGKSIQIWGMILPNGKLIIKELHQWSKSEDYIELLETFVNQFWTLRSEKITSFNRIMPPYMCRKKL